MSIPLVPVSLPARAAGTTLAFTLHHVGTLQDAFPLLYRLQLASSPLLVSAIRMNSDLMAQIHAGKALKSLSLAEGACGSSDASTQKAVDESAPDLKAFKNQLAGLFGGPSPKAAEPKSDVPVQAAAAPAAPPPATAAATPLTPTPSRAPSSLAPPPLATPPAPPLVPPPSLTLSRRRRQGRGHRQV